MNSPALPRADGSRSWIRELADPLQTLFYLRYCMRRNAWRKEKFLGRIITVLFWLAVTIGVVFVTALGLLLGYFVHFKGESDGPLYFWNIVVAVFLVAWLIQLSTDLFRNDVLTLDRIMHLPISPRYAFVLNYLSSLINFPLIYLAGFTSGTILGTSLVFGPVALLLGISLVAYMFMVTALTSQFQGALSAWMATPRRRQTIMIVLSLFFMLFFPAVSLVLHQMDDAPSAPPPPAVPSTDQPETPDATVSDETPSLDNEAAKSQVSGSQVSGGTKLDLLSSYLRWIQVCVPPLWLAACGSSLSESSWNAWWITPCMICLGWLSMQRGYQTTLRYYQDGFGTVVRSRKNTVGGNATSVASRLPWIERSIPGADAITSSIVMQTWLSMWRSPEFKFMLLVPLFQPIVLGFLVQYWKLGESEITRTLILLGFAGLQLFTASGQLGNQFGLDRGGFRTWVLSPIPRRAILHGRNIAFGLPVWILAVMLTLALGVWWGLAWDKLVFVALALTSFVPMYLLVSDLMSILSPFGIPPGTIQPKEFSWKQIVVSLAISTLHPTLLCLAALPFAVELLLERLFPGTADWPIAAALAVPWLGLSIVLYRLLLPWVARCFEHFELYILRIVTAPID
ncbi:MAG: hypothetical protein KGQ51_16125 [Planctomycetes bacterium]|nr:hypothetical protein [Planctomycetota bacterium]